MRIWGVCIAAGGLLAASSVSAAAVGQFPQGEMWGVHAGETSATFIASETVKPSLFTAKPVVMATHVKISRTAGGPAFIEQEIAFDCKARDYSVIRSASFTADGKQVTNFSLGEGLRPVSTADQATQASFRFACAQGPSASRDGATRVTASSWEDLARAL